MHELLVNRLFKPAHEKELLGELTVPQWPTLLTWDVKQQKQTNKQTNKNTGRGKTICLPTLTRGDTINRGSYMSAHVWLNLLNELGKSDKMRDLLSILSLFRNKFNKFNNTRARMLDSIYHMTLRLLQSFISGVIFFFIMYTTLLWTP